MKPLRLMNTDNRRSIRLRGYDYSRKGLYFVTICVRDRLPLFGEIVDDEMLLNEIGHIAKMEWLAMPIHRPYVVLHEFVIMPNHVHMIIEIAGTGNMNNGKKGVADAHAKGVACLKGQGVACLKGQGVARNAPTMSGMSPKGGTLSVIIRAYKSAVSKSIRKINSGFMWQRNFYEHIIRNQNDYERIAEYISNNPTQWQTDRFYTSC